MRTDDRSIQSSPPNHTAALAPLGDLINGYRDGAYTPLDVIEQRLARIEATDHELHAWVLVDGERARRQAEALADKSTAEIDALPLYGVPVGIKDIIDVDGWPTRAGSSLTDGAPQTQDAPIVARLREAGAILVGKTATTQFACFDPAPTRNPWNTSHTPGGSSSGSAAAVAAGHVELALGTQTGGSITRPASFCGLCGLKPTHGALPMEGITPVSARLDHVGPLAQHVDDLKRFWKAIQRTSADAEPASLATSEVIFIEEFMGRRIEPSVASAVAESVGVLRGHVDCPSTSLPFELQPALDAHALIMAVDAANVHRHQFEASPEAYAPGLREMIRKGLSMSPADYRRAVDLQLEVTDAIEGFLYGRIAVTPAAPTAALPSLGSTGDPFCNSLFSFTGMPTVCLPTRQRDSLGMPIGMQLIGARHTEQELLEVASSWEEQWAD